MKDFNTKIYFFFLFIIGLAVLLFLYTPPLYFLPKETIKTTITNPYNTNGSSINLPTIAGSLPAPLGYGHYVTIGQATTVYVELADTPERRTDGLSGRASLPQNAGMFFIFDKADYAGIWMKDMLFPIDIIWFDETHTIIQIDKNVSPNTYPKIFTPNRPSKYVLEVNAGFSDSFGVAVGQVITKSE